MKQYLLVFSFLFLSIFTCTAQTWRWATSFSGVTESWPVAIDKAGNVYESGYNLPGITVVSMDTGGHYRWSISNDTVTAMINNMATDTAGNLYLFGWYESSLTFGTTTITTPGLEAAFCAKLNSAGSVLWMKNIADSSSACMGGLDSMGNIYVTGNFSAQYLTMGSDTLTNHSTHTDIFAAKLDTAGNPIWATSFGGIFNDNVTSVAVTKSGDMCIEVSYRSPFLYIGTDTFTGPATQIFAYFCLVKYDMNGGLLWAKNLQTRDVDVDGGICLDAWNNIYFTGGYTQTIVFDNDSLPVTSNDEVFLAKYNSAGNEEWAKAVNNPNYINGWSVVADSFANVWISGSAATSSLSLDTMFLLRLDSAGNVNDSILLASGGDDASALATDNKGGLYLGDDYNVDSFVIGADTLSLSGGTETLFLAKYCYLFCYAEEATHTPLIPESGINLYPNPAGNEITISCPAGITDITINNIMGQIVSSRSCAGTQQLDINIAQLPAGVYFVKVNGTEVRKFVKE